MQAAFETLGIPTYHWLNMAENPPDMPMWQEALKAKFVPDSGIAPFTRKDWNQLLGHVGATTDQPCAIFTEELVNAYPEVKVVLVERDVEKWYKSFNDTVITSQEHPLISLARWLDKVYIDNMGILADLVSKYYFGARDSRDGEGMRKNAKATYLRHNEMVKRVTPKERLLLFNLEDGWGPLCEFLGKPVPDAPFPKLNETAVLEEKVNLIIGKSFKKSAVRYTKKLAPFAVIAVALAIWYLRQ